MGKTFVSRSPILVLILLCVAVASMIFPHDIGTTTINTDCPVNTICDGSTKMVKHTGFPYVWKTKTIIDDVTTNISTNTKRMEIDVAFWVVLILLIGLFPIKSEVV